ncbi:hypothetical protein [Nocardioides sp.]|uniref:hypothetical protein n=1 Tax=Nocardioides sp. TaxID=35761 RepID=UPI002726B57D|nr:hypothetical protein [Nocardioides sp.]MDO9455255.1 hypothetical protein [Nocardioides sp.]
MTSSMARSTKRLLTAAAVIQLLLVTFLAVLLVRGTIFGDEPRRYARLLFVALIIGAVACVLVRLRVSVQDTPGLNTQTTVLTALTLGAAIWGAAGLAFPSSPGEASAPRCEGAPSSNGAQNVQTRPGGVNVRAEPSITGSQVGRLSGDCVITVDGFCVGSTPLHDAVSLEHVDVRWFRLYRIRGWDEPFARVLSGGAAEERFVAASTITSFVTNMLVPELDAAECVQSEPVPAPGKPTLRRDPNLPDRVVFDVTAPNTYEFGVSLLVLGETTLSSPYRKITTWERPNDVTLAATWVPAATATYLKEDSDVVVFGGRCFAIGAPMKATPADAAVITYKLKTDGTLHRRKKTPALSQDQLDTLAATACREDRP